MVRPGGPDVAHLARVGSGQILSDGESPSQVRLPAYVAALVLVRNVVVKHKTEAAAVANGPLRFTLSAQLLTLPRLAARPVVDRGPIAPRVPVKRAAVNLRTIAPRAMAMRPLINIGPILARTPPAAASAPATPPAAAPTRAFSRLKSDCFTTVTRRPRIVIPPRRTADPAPSAGTTDPAAPAVPAVPDAPPPDGTISVLAFICKRLPKAPDPLPGLIWGSSAATAGAIAGDWVDTDGFTYRFSQDGAKISYLQLQNDAQVGTGTGEFDGARLTYTYQAGTDSGQCTGQLAPDGTRIEGSCSSGGHSWQFSITRSSSTR
jgi:hypothetical protein